MKTQPKIFKTHHPETIGQLVAESNYTYLYLKNGEKVLSAYHLKAFEDWLDTKTFLRVNRSTLVNISMVRSYDIKRLSLKLKDNSRIKVPRRKSQVIKAQLPSLFSNG
ncbi:LytTR family transcriptional regulator DNA-binding domain-containing protein [Jiulongibacter sp. NS-SX5]|uniref:LytTR family transcriptional regulator DNA-binding domain-containing protein n=1 Tax=Jiulongibacter sp. NS-SX5 TaxID=3463854 RepID=UPI00405849C8